MPLKKIVLYVHKLKLFRTFQYGWLYFKNTDEFSASRPDFGLK